MPAACMLSRAFGLMLLLWSAAARSPYGGATAGRSFTRGADLFAPSISPTAARSCISATRTMGTVTSPCA